jgi:hypothetical protein
MLFKALGPRYVVWDKSASIRFRKPGKQTLYAKYVLAETDLQEIKASVKEKSEITKTFTIQWVDKDQVVHAEIERLCYIADKDHYQKKKGDSQKAKLEFVRRKQ